MPLKHDTETLLVFLLGLLTVAAGIVCAFLPPVSVSLWPWLIAFALSLIYPFALYPYLKERRADNPFRLLHFAPAAILLLWLGSDLLAGTGPRLSVMQDWFTWKSGLLPVLIVLFLMAWFCVSVIRQRWSRLLLLALLIISLGAVAAMNSRYHWDRQLAATLWGESGSLLVFTNSGTSVSSDAELRWREQLRLMEERRRAIAAGGTGSVLPSQGSKSSSTIIAGASSSASSKPQDLPHAGPTADVLMLLTMTGFTTAVHRRTIRRRARGEV